MCASRVLFKEKRLAHVGQTHYCPVSLSHMHVISRANTFYTESFLERTHYILSHMHVISSRHAGGEAHQRRAGGVLRNINSDPHSVRARPYTGAVSGGYLRKPSPRVGPSHHVLEARNLHAATTPTLCENVPIRLYQG